MCKTRYREGASEGEIKMTSEVDFNHVLTSKANAGDSEAMFQLGVSCAFGRGAELDLEKALHWLKKAAKAGHTVAAEVLKDIGRTRETSNEIGECEGDEKIKRVQLWKDGPYWADRNIGAENPWDWGYYFWWGDTIGYERKNGRWVASDGSNSNFSFNKGNTFTYGLSESELRRLGWITPDGVLSSDHDAAHKHWGGGWRMPTKADFKNLVNKCNWQWTIMNGVEGYVVRGRGKYASKSIFFPAAGQGYDTSLGHSGSYGYFLSSVPYSDSYNARLLYFYSSDRRTDLNSRDDGQSVRPVLGFTK
jgi:TPR repeat protein